MLLSLTICCPNSVFYQDVFYCRIYSSFSVTKLKLKAPGKTSKFSRSKNRNCCCAANEAFAKSQISCNLAMQRSAEDFRYNLSQRHLGKPLKISRSRNRNCCRAVIKSLVKTQISCNFAMQLLISDKICHKSKWEHLSNSC